MVIVLDASVVVAALVDGGPIGTWADGLLDEAMAAPTLLPFEVSNVLRRSAMRGAISNDIAALANEDLLALAVTFVPYESIAERIWELRHNLTAYDASYVAVAEALGAPLATLDSRITTASGPTCPFLVPPIGSSA